jgi:hypothetical protein
VQVVSTYQGPGAFWGCLLALSAIGFFYSVRTRTATSFLLGSAPVSGAGDGVPAIANFLIQIIKEFCLKIVSARRPFDFAQGKLCATQNSAAATSFLALEFPLCSRQVQQRIIQLPDLT